MILFNGKDIINLEKDEVAEATNEKEEHQIVANNEENKRAIASSDEEEYPILLLDIQSEIIVEIFKSTGKMRYWDAENKEYVECFCQAYYDRLKDVFKYHKPNESESEESEVADEVEEKL